MTADKSKRAILVCAMLAVSTIPLTPSTALATQAAHIPGKYRIRSGAQARQIDCKSVPRAAPVHMDVHDPFASMLLG
jgi:hypothetical protein